MRKLTLTLILIVLVGCTKSNLNDDVKTINFNQELTQETVKLKVVN